MHSSRVKDRIRTRQKTDVSTQHIARKDNEEGWESTSRPCVLQMLHVNVVSQRGFAAKAGSIH